MPQFQLQEFLPVTMTTLSLPARKKGTDVIHTTDIGFEFEGSNKLLDLFDPALLPMIFRAAESESEVEQKTLEGVDQVSDLPMLRSAAIKMPLLLALEYAGYTMIIDRGLGEQREGSNIQCDEVTVKRIRIWCKEGGAIKGHMHLQSRNVSSEQVGQLREFLKLQTQLKLLAPVVKQSTMSDADAKQHYQEKLASGDPLAADLKSDQPGKPGAGGRKAAADKAAAAEKAKADKAAKSLKERQAKARQTAEDAFIAAHGAAANGDSANEAQDEGAAA